MSKSLAENARALAIYARAKALSDGAPDSIFVVIEEIMADTQPKDMLLSDAIALAKLVQESSPLCVPGNWSHTVVERVLARQPPKPRELFVHPAGLEPSNHGYPIYAFHDAETAQRSADGRIGVVIKFVEVPHDAG